MLARALKRHEPWLEWSGKRERPWFEVEPVALHMHERVSTQAILRALARQDVQRELFADPQHDYAQAVQFYRHNVDWANRMILGDSLQVMASLARREDLAGKVQMIYLDPPYGIRFASNFQPQLGQRDVKDRQQDLTREPEMVKAYRDTWTLGIHSYLAYLHDWLAMARELLTDTGSIFVQIGEDNRHYVRMILEELFQPQNFIAEITYRTSISLSGEFIDSVCNYLIWFARDKEKAARRYRQLNAELDIGEEGATRYRKAESKANGEVRNINSEGGDNVDQLPESDWRFFTDQGLTSRSGSATTLFQVPYQGKMWSPTAGGWRTSEDGMRRLLGCERVLPAGDTIRFKKYFDDFGAWALTNFWNDVTGGVQSRNDPKIYTTQTGAEVVKRCMLMTTDPGDLVLDPTCGSGTTAYVAEQWGRRWITIDTSRVALALAKHRLMTAKFDYYRLRELNAEDLERNPRGTWIAGTDGDRSGKPLTFQCKTVPHITLRSIARNTSLDPIFAKHDPILAARLADLNHALATVSDELKASLAAKLIAKHREQGANAVTDAELRRWLLPGTHPGWLKTAPARKPLKGLTARQVENYRAKIPGQTWQAWQVPFDADPDWPQPLQAALTAYRAAWRAKMDEVNACIAANAASEELVDKPELVKSTLRVAGPFTMEGVIALEDGLDMPASDAESDEELEAFDNTGAAANAEAHIDRVIRLLRAAGVDFPGNATMQFDRLEPLAGPALLHAEGGWLENGSSEREEGDGQADPRVAVSIGPEVGNITAMQVEEAVRDANRAGYDELVFAGFGFDAAAQEAIEAAGHPRLRLHMALIRPDVAMGDLLKTQPGSQLFAVFSAPRVTGPARQSDGNYTVEVEGMDVYDPVSNTLFPTDRQRIAAWFLDTDYDGRTFCICQAFFPDKTKWDRLARALGDAGVIDRTAFDALSGLTSLPFPRPARLPAGAPWRIAVKMIDPRGNEGLRVLSVTAATP